VCVDNYHITLQTTEKNSFIQMLKPTKSGQSEIRINKCNICLEISVCNCGQYNFPVIWGFAVNKYTLFRMLRQTVTL
jgi:hypothetical protein